jgi:peptide-methionine (S)-S-oxide reductase
MSDSSETIVLGGGCFWCTEAVYVKVRGITDVESGYSNGKAERPSYEQVCTGNTGHNEVVKLTYDSSQISLRQILEIFFVIHDPTTLNRQGNDSGTQYRSGIYFTTPEQQQAAREMIQQMTRDKLFGKPIVTEVEALSNYTRTSSKKIRTRAIAWRSRRPRWRSSARPSPTWSRPETAPPAAGGRGQASEAPRNRLRPQGDSFTGRW